MIFFVSPSQYLIENALGMKLISIKPRIKKKKNSSAGQAYYSKSQKA